jgi:hypothetical protein
LSRKGLVDHRCQGLVNREHWKPPRMVQRGWCQADFNGREYIVLRSRAGVWSDEEENRESVPWSFTSWVNFKVFSEIGFWFLMVGLILSESQSCEQSVSITPYQRVLQSIQLIELFMMPLWAIRYDHHADTKLFCEAEALAKSSVHPCHLIRVLSRYGGVRWVFSVPVPTHLVSEFLPRLTCLAANRIRLVAPVSFGAGKVSTLFRPYAGIPIQEPNGTPPVCGIFRNLRANRQSPRKSLVHSTWQPLAPVFDRAGL